MDVDFSRIQFTDMLTRCHNIIRDNDKLSPEAAFDETSKILFIKIQRERAEGKIYTMAEYIQEKKNYLKNFAIEGMPYYQFIFRQTKERYREEEIFDEHDTIKIREHSFEAIIENLEELNLASIQDDAKGIAFEHFLGKTFRGELGQFFTPRAVVNFMVGILRPQENELCCDPCCGSGGFLISAFDDIRRKIEADETASEAVKVARIAKLATSCLFGVDANARMARVAKMNMIMHGDGHTCVYHHDGLLNVNGVFENRFDVIFTNPPFGSRVNKNLYISEAERFTDEAKKRKNIQLYGPSYLDSLKQVDDHIGEPLISLFHTGAISNITEVLFIERCLDLLKPGGRMGIVLPDGVLSNDKLQPVREYIESRAKILLIISLPNDIFVSSGAAIKSSIMFFQKFAPTEEQNYQNVFKEETDRIEEFYREKQETLKAEIRQASTKEEKSELKGRQEKLRKRKHEELLNNVRKRLNYQIPKGTLDETSVSRDGIEAVFKVIEEEYHSRWSER